MSSSACDAAAGTAAFGGPAAAAEPAGPRGKAVNVLVVDDEEGIRLVLTRILEHCGCAVTQADSVAAARAHLSQVRFDLVLLDVRMPQENGYVLLRELAPQAPDTAVVMVTAGDDVESAVAAMKEGAYDYIRKPFTMEAVQMAVTRALERRQLEIENRTHRTQLQELVRERTREVQRVARRLAETQTAIIWIACSLAESRDGQTGAHLDRMAAYCRVLALALPEEVRVAHGLGDGYPDQLEESAPLHDIGKVAIPDSILLKKGRLTNEEWQIMRRHPMLGLEILETVRRRLEPERIPLLDMAVEICAAHHERWDGGGYPEGLAGEAIPLSARIAALADFYDATTSPRAYRPVSFSHDHVREMICRERGGAFDPGVVEAFLAAEDRVIAVRDRLRDMGNVFGQFRPTTVADNGLASSVLPGAAAWTPTALEAGAS